MKNGDFDDYKLKKKEKLKIGPVHQQRRQTEIIACPERRQLSCFRWSLSELRRPYGKEASLTTCQYHFRNVCLGSSQGYIT